MKISVVIPVYNKEKYMDDLFQCLLSQTFEEFECILIDDGSTDASGEICDKVACIDKRFEVIHIPNSGVSHARNVGIDASCGEYITFIDADDRIPNNYLENLYETIIESGVDLSICTITKIWHSGKKKKIQLPGSGTFDISELLLNFADYQKKTGIYGYCCGKIILKELVGNIRFDERIKLAEDFDFFLKLYPKVSKICFNDKTEYFYLQESENSSAMVKDSEIDYRTQLFINIRYKHFLEKENVYSGSNELIVSQLLSNYVVFSLLYCNIEKLKNCFEELQLICKSEGIKACGRNFFEKWILLLLYENKYYLLKISLQLRRLMRHLIRRLLRR